MYHANFGRDSSTVPTGRLLLDFFELYGTRFGYESTGISVLGGGTYFKKAERGWLDPRFPFVPAVEDPQNPSLSATEGRGAVERGDWWRGRGRSNGRERASHTRSDDRQSLAEAGKQRGKGFYAAPVVGLCVRTRLWNDERSRVGIRGRSTHTILLQNASVHSPSAHTPFLPFACLPHPHPIRVQVTTSGTTAST